MKIMADKSIIQHLSREVFEKVLKVRHHIHQYPELSFEEKATATFICEILSEEGIEFQAGVGGEGIVARIGKVGSKTIALRADMDALPIREATGAPYSSLNEGVMHACGHDAHTACLIGAALVLNRIREELDGEVRLIFQPGEELLPGGASKMIAAGVLERPVPESIFGQHVHPELPVGSMGYCAGAFMASSDELYIRVEGRGGHAAMPHRLKDPVLAASALILALQQVVSRKTNPLIPSVLSFGRFMAEGATNVIPSKVDLAGTFRTFDEAWRNAAHAEIEKICRYTGETYSVSIVPEIRKGYPVLNNHGDLTKWVKEKAEDLLGKEKVVKLEPRMTAEDFAYYSHVVPASFWRLGTASIDGRNSYPVHHPQFNIDEGALETGTALMSWLALSRLKE